MAVVYMRKLEQEPESYDSKFTALTKGVNKKIEDWIIEKIDSENSILEIGCGTGSLAIKLADKGNNVKAIDINFKMIDYAMKNYPPNLKDGSLTYQIGSFTDLPVEKQSQDIILSKFMLSELRPFEQQIFLRNCWKTLKQNGILILAAEFVPSGFWKLPFQIKRWWYRRKLRRLKLKSTFLLKWFFNYIKPIGFEIIEQKEWKHGTIKALILKKSIKAENDEPGYYFPEKKKFKGISSQFRIYRCLFTGQIDRVPIEPGVYKSGNPDKDSPIIVTANYDYTYIKVMRNIKKVNAWVLCVDSNGINVWCAARGNDFGNDQLIEAIKATGIQNITESRSLILPQLSAGGVAIPQLRMNSKKFPYKIKYGPVWSKDLPSYLKEKPIKKPEKMKLAKFTLSHRNRAFITHTTFLFRKIFLYPLFGLLIILIALTWINKLWWVLELAIWVVITNAITAYLFPLSKFTRKFIYKGIFFGILNVIVLSLINFSIQKSIFKIIWSIGFYFWISFFSTMSFSGYTMATSPREIQIEYPVFRKINLALLIISIICLVIAIIYF
ncbi:MAG: methyltransferase domain-containing protein [Candidatus Hodarchaeota archaeon]